MAVRLPQLFSLDADDDEAKERIGGRGKRGKVLIPEDAIEEFSRGYCAELED